MLLVTVLLREALVVGAVLERTAHAGHHCHGLRGIRLQHSRRIVWKIGVRDHLGQGSSCLLSLLLLTVRPSYISERRSRLCQRSGSKQQNDGAVFYEHSVHSPSGSRRPSRSRVVLISRTQP